jgi:Flp pilus assembly pilin Flp
MKLMKQLLSDEAGFVVSSELVLVATILVIGMITGLTTLRDGVIQELVDLGQAIGNVDQSYTYNGATAHTSATNGSAYVDASDFCEDQQPADTAGAEPGCLVISGLTVSPGADGEDNDPLAPVN